MVKLSAEAFCSECKKSSSIERWKYHNPVVGYFAREDIRLRCPICKNYIPLRALKVIMYYEIKGV